MIRAPLAREVHGGRVRRSESVAEGCAVAAEIEGRDSRGQTRRRGKMQRTSIDSPPARRPARQGPAIFPLSLSSNGTRNFACAYTRAGATERTSALGGCRAQSSMRESRPAPSVATARRWRREREKKGTGSCSGEETAPFRARVRRTHVHIYIYKRTHTHTHTVSLFSFALLCSVLFSRRVFSFADA